MEPDRTGEAIAIVASTLVIVLIVLTAVVLIAENHPNFAHLLPECRPVRLPDG